MWQISRVIGLAFMTGFSVEDLRFRTVSRDLLSIMAILGIGYQLWTRETSWKQIMGGVVIGMFFIFISFITKEALGYGDSILISILGIFVGMTELIEILILSWCVVVIVSMILMAKRRFSRKTALPFVPFLLIGYSIVSICTYYTGQSGGV